jgi:hypothetical protein
MLLATATVDECSGISSVNIARDSMDKLCFQRAAFARRDDSPYDYSSWICMQCSGVLRMTAALSYFNNPDLAD